MTSGGNCGRIAGKGCGGVKGKYVRLRLKLLLWVALGALGAARAAVLRADVVLGGAAGALIYRLFVWAAGALFGQSPERADLLYQQYIQANRPLAVTGAACVLLLAAFYENRLIYLLFLPALVLLALVQRGGYIPDARNLRALLRPDWEEREAKK